MNATTQVPPDLSSCHEIAHRTCTLHYGDNNGEFLSTHASPVFILVQVYLEHRLAACSGKIVKWPWPYCRFSQPDGVHLHNKHHPIREVDCFH